MGDRFQTRSNENSKLEEGLRGGLNRARNLKGASPATGHFVNKLNRCDWLPRAAKNQGRSRGATNIC